MMQEELRQQYVSYIKKICKNEILQKHAISYFDDLGEFFKDKLFYATDFEKLEVNGQTFEQDVCADLFKETNSVTAQQLFFEIVKRNLSEITLFPGREFLDDKYTRASYNLATKVIKVKDFTNSQNGDLLNSNKLKIFSQDSIDKIKEIYLDDLYFGCIYHELSHLFELKTFCDRKYCKNGMIKHLLINGEFGWVISDSPVIVRGDYERAYAQQYAVSYPKNEIFSFIRRGANLISESLNETFCSQVGKIFCIEDADILNQNRISHKKEVFGDCEYNNYYDIAYLLRVLGDVDIKDVRFDSKKIIDNINAIKLPHNVKESFLIQVFEQCKHYDTMRDFDIGAVQNIDFDNYDMVSLMVGLCEKNQQFKVLTKDYLLKCLQVNLSKAFETKNSNDFFSKIDTILCNIDDFLDYPAKCVKLKTLTATVPCINILNIHAMANVVGAPQFVIMDNILTQLKANMIVSGHNGELQILKRQEILSQNLENLYKINQSVENRDEKNAQNINIIKTDSLQNGMSLT